MHTIVIFAILFILASFKGIEGQRCGCRRNKLLRRDDDIFKRGDMLFDVLDVSLMHGFKANYPNAKRWPSGQVLYTFGNGFARDKVQFVRQCLSELQQSLGGCVKFAESGNGHHIEVNSYNQGCFSMVGVSQGQGNSQQMNLQSPGCVTSKGTVKHEFIHALGFMHTHMRKDRDNYINILWDKIDSSMCNQFDKCEGCDLGGPYETTSVMHYGSDSFSCRPGEMVVLKRDGGVIGYNHETTPNDINMIRSFYKC